MVISFPEEGSEKKMQHRYAAFNCLAPATGPAVGNPIRRRRIEFNPAAEPGGCAAG
jgi:hypothetical protein